jgi:uncharacterized protein
MGTPQSDRLTDRLTGLFRIGPVVSALADLLVGAMAPWAWNGRRTMIRSSVLALAMCCAAPSWAAASREMSLGRRGATLKATLVLPEGDARVPGVLILAGSGPTDRDGNSHLPGGVLRNDSLKMLADALAERGIASLRADKRGIAASAGPDPDEAALRFPTYVEDAQAWAALLAREPRISRLLILGHSEGALVATMAAQRLPVSGLILIAGAGEPAGSLMRRQFAAGALPPALRADADHVLSELEAGRAVNDPPPALAALFRPGVQPYLISWLPLDPAAELRDVRAPVLIIQGTTDLQVDPENARRLATARPDAKLLFVKGMNHVLKATPADRAANVAAYSNPALPLAPGLVDAVSDFILGPGK